MKYPSKLSNPPTSFNFKPACQMHLRNLRTTYKQAIKTQARTTKFSAPTRPQMFAEFAEVALAALDIEIAANKFINLSEYV